MKLCLQVVFFLLAALETRGQTCSRVFEEVVHCASQGSITISCPAGFHVSVINALPKTLKNPGCSNELAAAEEACTIEPLTSYIQQILCLDKQTCTVPASVFGSVSLSRCSDYEGENILHYKYRCESAAKQQASLCQNGGWSGSSIAVGPDPAAFTGQVGNSMIHDTSCACSVTVPANKELVIERSLFLVSPFKYSCEQRVVVSDTQGNILSRMCLSEAIHHTLNCTEEERTVFITYETDSTDVMATFIVNVYVQHEHRFQTECGLTYDHATTPTTTTTTTPVPTTTVTESSTEQITMEATTSVSHTTDEPVLTTVVGYIKFAEVMLEGQSTSYNSVMNDTGSDIFYNVAVAAETVLRLSVATLDSVVGVQVIQLTQGSINAAYEVSVCQGCSTPSKNDLDLALKKYLLSQPGCSANSITCDAADLKDVAVPGYVHPTEEATSGGHTISDRVSNESGVMFGLTREVLIGIIAGALVFMMFMTFVIIIIKGRCTAMNETPSTLNIAENLYDEPQYNYIDSYDVKPTKPQVYPVTMPIIEPSAPVSVEPIPQRPPPRYSDLDIQNQKRPLSLPSEDDQIYSSLSHIHPQTGLPLHPMGSLPPPPRAPHNPIPAAPQTKTLPHPAPLLRQQTLQSVKGYDDGYEINASESNMAQNPIFGRGSFHFD